MWSDLARSCPPFALGTARTPLHTPRRRTGPPQAPDPKLLAEADGVEDEARQAKGLTTHCTQIFHAPPTLHPRTGKVRYVDPRDVPTATVCDRHSLYELLQQRAVVVHVFVGGDIIGCQPPYASRHLGTQPPPPLRELLRLLKELQDLLVNGGVGADGAAAPHCPNAKQGKLTFAVSHGLTHGPWLQPYGLDITPAVVDMAEEPLFMDMEIASNVPDVTRGILAVAVNFNHEPHPRRLLPDGSEPPRGSPKPAPLATYTGPLQWRREALARRDPLEVMGDGGGDGSPPPLDWASVGAGTMPRQVQEVGEFVRRAIAGELA